MSTATGVEASLEEKQARREELRAQSAQVERDADAARKRGDVDALAALEARRVALAQVLALVEAEVKTLEEQRDREQSKALREEQIDTLATLAGRANRLRGEIDAAILDAHQRFVDSIDAIIDLQGGLSDARRQYKRLLATPDPVPGSRSSRELEARERGVSLDIVANVHYDRLPEGLLLGLFFYQGLEARGNALALAREAASRPKLPPPPTPESQGVSHHFPDVAKRKALEESTAAHRAEVARRERDKQLDETKLRQRARERQAELRGAPVNAETAPAGSWPTR